VKTSLESVKLVVLCACLAATACGDSATPAAPVCDQACQDGIALRAVREMAKLVFNLTIQGKPVGPQDATVPCPLGGSARVFGTANANAIQGTVEVDLTYVFEACGYTERDDDAGETYALTVSTRVTQKGTFASQSTATTAVVMQTEAVTLAGTVSNPPLDYRVEACALTLTQNGNDVTGLLCERMAGFRF
jgi:hypothetical protein